MSTSPQPGSRRVLAPGLHGTGNRTWLKVKGIGAGGAEAPAAARLVPTLGTKPEVARELCYRLYTIGERQKRAEDALRYNALVQSWPGILRLAGESAEPQHPTLIGA